MQDAERSTWEHIRAKFTLRWIIVSAITALAGALATGAGKPILTWATDSADHMRDAMLCGGHAAMTEGDRLSALAERDAARAQALFKEANPHYAKAYRCGFPDAGIRLAVAHCMGLGTPKDHQKARQLVLEIEGKHPTKIGRAGDVRKVCGL